MNPKHILIILVIAGLSSCSSAYKIVQTPDDVYYSPAPQQNVYVQSNNEDNGNVYNNSSPEDREILRHINNRRWRRLHNYDYDYPYGGSYYPYGYNYPVPIYVDPKTGSLPTYTGPRKYDLGSYTKPPVPVYTIDPKTGKVINVPNPAVITGSGTPVRTFKPNNGTTVGNLLRKVFNNPNANTNTYDKNADNNTQSRSFEPSKNSSNNSNSSSSNSSRSSSSGGSNAPVRTFGK